MGLIAIGDIIHRDKIIYRGRNGSPRDRDSAWADANMNAEAQMCWTYTPLKIL